MALPFLDLLISRCGDRFTFSLYSKPSHSNHVIPWTSHHARSILINALSNEFRRAISHGSDNDEMDKGIKLINSRYKANGYPSKILSKCLRRAKYPIPRKEEKLSRSFLTLPFISEQQTRAIRSTLRKCGLQDYLTVSFSSRNIASFLKPRRKKTCPKENC